MELPKVQNPNKYVGLYVIDFGDHCSVGFTAQEVAELLESERFKDIKVYKIHNAYHDGRMELKGIVRNTFELESGMFFYAQDIGTARDDYKRLVDMAAQITPPGRAKIHLAKCQNDSFVTALIYPAEYDDEFSAWLLDGSYRTSGEVSGGISSVQYYYEQKHEVIERDQLFGKIPYISRTGEPLLASVRQAMQR